MSEFKIDTEANVIDVSFSRDNFGDDFVSLDSNGLIKVYESHSLVKPIRPHSCISSLNLSTKEQYLFRQIFYISPSKLLVIAHSPITLKDELISFILDGKNEIIAYSVVKVSDDGLLRGYLDSDSQGEGVVYIQDCEAVFWKVEFNDNEWKATFIEKLPSVCTDFIVSNLKFDNSEETVVFGLTSRNKFYINNRVLSTDSLSFTIHDLQFLVLTTLTHSSIFIKLNNLKSVTDIKIEETEKDSLSAFDERRRKVERGSSIVLTVPGDVSLILQMPRGNLETIYPRSFVLTSIRSFIDEGEYKKAFISCRKHRIDLNLLYDHNPAQFLERVVITTPGPNSGFVYNGVDSPEWLNLFLSGLRNEDVTVTMYPDFANKIAKMGSKLDTTKKVDKVCKAIRDTLIILDEDRYQNSVLTTFVKQTPPDLESSMKMIREIKEKKSTTSAEKSLAYIIFLVDVESLYNTALGLYDFSLVLMVAQLSQKDPREYLPFLNELQKLKTYKQKFRIDDYLNKKESALVNLRMSCREKEDGDGSDMKSCMDYICKNEIYVFALELFRDDSIHYKTVLKLYANHLINERNQFEEGSILYRLAGEHALALDGYKQAGKWSEMFAMAFELGYNDQEIRGISLEILDVLIDRRQYVDASTIYLAYLMDVKEAVLMLLKGSCYNEAIRICHLHKKVELIQDEVKPAVFSAFEMLHDDITQMLVTFKKQRDRLITIREDRARKILELSQLPINDDLDDIDVMSDTSSMATTKISAYTRYTALTGNTGYSGLSTNSTRNAKGRRKTERKKHSGKKGGAFEEEYLMKTLKKSMEKSNNMMDEVSTLIKMLMTFSYETKAKELQNIFKEIRQEYRNARSLIFKISEVSPVLTTEEQSIKDEAAAALNETPVIAAPDMGERDDFETRFF